MGPSCARPEAPLITKCMPLQPHMALPFTSATASSCSWYACRKICVCVHCSRAPEGGQDEGYYYTPMTYHCYQMGPRGS